MGVVFTDNKPLENLETCLFRLVNIRRVSLGGKFTYLVTSVVTESKNLLCVFFNALDKC